MKLFLGLVFAVLALVPMAHVIAEQRFLGRVAELAGVLERGPTVTSNIGVPSAMAAFARGNGGGETGLRAVRLEQEAELILDDGVTREITATQWIGLGAPGFVWSARQPGAVVPSIRILDAYVGGTGVLRAQLFGSIPVAHFAGPEIDLGEAMRYLAELPWAPDAILGNPEVVWGEEAGWITAALPVGARMAQVRFRFEAGDIAEMRAEGRPSTAPDGTTTLRDWRGLFSDYAEIGGRRIPRRAEVGYVDDGVYAPYWRGRIVDHALLK